MNPPYIFPFNPDYVDKQGYLKDSNLFPVNARLTKAWDSRDELRDMSPQARRR